MPTEEQPNEASELVVVGGGVIGLACAWRAANAGMEVLVIDAGSEGRASDVAAGMLAPVGEADWNQEPLIRAALLSAGRWPEFAAELSDAAGVEVPLRRCGALHVALDRDELEQLRREHELHGRLGLDSEWLRGSGCRALEPGLASAATGGYVVPGEAEVDPRAVTAALRVAVERAGGRVVSGEVIGLRVQAGRVRGVELADGAAIVAERVLVASGARAGGGLLPEAERIPVRPVKGEVVRLRARAEARPCERIISTERVYLVPRAGDEVVIGATVEEHGFDTRVTAGGVYELLREAYRVLPEIAELELVECSAGLRPGTPDNAPVIGASGVEGLLIAAGHYRNGILLTPATADAVMALLAGEPVAAEIEPLAPGRFAGAGVAA